jgi:hypothetical protein
LKHKIVLNSGTKNYCHKKIVSLLFRTSPQFPYHLATHPAVVNRLDPMLPLCPFQLRGRCADPDCAFQHDRDYRLTGHQIVEEFLEQLCSCQWMSPRERGFKKFL